MAETVKYYTLAEVAKHKTNSDVWIVVHNSIYNVTEFLNEHPGGEEVLIEQAGSDATEAFEDVGHSSDAREMMAKYKVGELVEAERKKVPQKTPATWNSDENKPEESSTKSWIITLLVGIVASIAYRYWFRQ